MWDWNVERDEVSYNDHWRVSLGIDPQELLSRESLSERLMLPADRSEILEQFEQYFRGTTSLFECDYSLPSTSGEQKWFAVRAQVAERDARGKALRVIGVLRDISRRKRELDIALPKCSSAGSVPCAVPPTAFTTGIC